MYSCLGKLLINQWNTSSTNNRHTVSTLNVMCAAIVPHKFLRRKVIRDSNSKLEKKTPMYFLMATYCSIDLSVVMACEEELL